MSNQAKGMTLIMTAILLAMGVVGGMENQIDIDLTLGLQYAGALLVAGAAAVLGLSFIEE
jgi:hypothetical protein